MKRNRWKLLTFLIAAVVLITTVTLSVYAYFSTRVYVYTDDGKEVAHLGMNLQLLFGKLKPGSVQDTVYDEDGNVTTPGAPLKIPYYENNGTHNIYHEGGDTDSPTFDSTKPWGSPQNPYIIANERHLQNLSALQSIGYFDLMYISKNFTNGTYNNGISMPYFLVCTEEGTPTVINASDIGTIKPVGSAEHPFIGVVGGAFVEGSATVAGKATTVSAFHNVKVQTTTDQTDVGLFGYVGYLGTEPTNGSDFPGEVSILQNFLLSDVQIIVNKPTIAEEVSQLFASLFGDNHNFTYTDKDRTDAIPEPEETNHIGILAGHVSYATVENISVYYSKDDIYAIDLTGNDGKNYHSSTGILGFMHNMNADVTNVMTTDGTAYNGHCQISISGMSSDGVSVPSTGTGTGGGALSGNGRGYVTAAEIYSTFNYADAGDSMSDALWNYTLRGGASYQNAILVYGKASTASDGTVTYTYTFADGSPASFNTVDGDRVVTNASGATVNVNFFIRMANEDENNKYTYYGEDGQTRVDRYEMVGDRQNGQQLWRFEAGGDGIWHYGILIVKNANGTYTLEDGKTAVTVTNGVATDGTNSWTGYMVKTTVDDKTVYLDSTETLPVTSYNRKSMLIYGAVNKDGDNLCQQWYRNSLWSEIFGADPEATGMYYFYDGVFTFALSSMDDTITDTWENNEPPTIYLGADNAAAWEINYAAGNRAVIAFLRPVDNNADLDQAIKEGKQIYITAKPNEQTNPNESFLMTLQKKNAEANTTGHMFVLDNATGDTVKQSYAGGEFTTMPKVPITQGNATVEVPMFYKDANGNSVNMTVGNLLDNWDDYEILNIGRTSSEVTLDELKNKYNIVPSAGENDYYFRADTGVHVEPANGVVPEYATWNGYFYYEWVHSRESGGFIRDHVYTVTYYYQEPDGGAKIKLGTSKHNAGNWGSEFDYSYVDCSAFIRAATNGLQNELMYYEYLDPNDQTWKPASGMYLAPGATTWAETSNLPMICMTETIAFHSTGTTALINGSSVAKNTGNNLDYYYYDVVGGKYYLPNGTDLGTTDPKYTNRVLLNKYPSYSFHDNTYSDPSYLQLIYRYQSALGIRYNQKYSIWAGTDTQFESLANRKQQITQEGVLVFEPNKDYCYIRYPNGNNSLYVNYAYDGQSGSFGESTTNAAGSNTKLYVYIVEGILDMDYGVNSFIPKDYGEAGSTSLGFSADEYVFWPQYTLTDTGYSENTGYNGTRTDVASGTINATNTSSKDPIYQLVPLWDESNPNALNWGTADGYKLGSNGGYGLTQKFQMADQAGFGPMITLGDIDISLSRPYTQLVAPIGSEGVEAVIPKGCVAFRVNEVNESSSVRIVVAVPTSSFYMTGYDSSGNIQAETGFDLDLVMDYYVGMWQIGAAGDSWISSFNKEDAVEKFELPRSYSFDFASTPQDVEAKTADAAFKNYQTVSYNGKNYRTYLNGGTILVAYEFQVTEVGVYVIGSVHGDSETETTMDVPMEIVHFSVSGTASAGNDGVSGSKIGSVDFVYDYANKIITVGTVGQGGYQDTEDYNNYYASRCLVFTANDFLPDPENDPDGFIDLKNVKLSVRRKIVEGNNPQRTTSIKVQGDNQILVQLSRYSIFSDTVTRDPELNSQN